MTEVFTRAEVLSLNAYQEAGYCHPYTCPNEHRVMSGEAFDEPVCLHATPEGWICWWPNCEYEQGWAHDFAKDWSWLEWKQSWHPEVQKEE